MKDAETRIIDAVNQVLETCEIAKKENQSVLIDPVVLESLCLTTQNHVIQTKSYKFFMRDYALTWDYILPKALGLSFWLGIAFCLLVIQVGKVLLPFLI